MKHNAPFTKSGREDVCIEDVCWSMAHSSHAHYRGATVCVWTYGLHALLCIEEAKKLGYNDEQTLSVAFCNGVDSCYGDYSGYTRIRTYEYLRLPCNYNYENDEAYKNADNRVMHELIICDTPNMLACLHERVVLSRLLKLYQEWIKCKFSDG